MPTQSYARIERLRIRKCSSNRLNQIKHDAKMVQNGRSESNGTKSGLVNKWPDQPCHVRVRVGRPARSHLSADEPLEKLATAAWQMMAKVGTGGIHDIKHVDGDDDINGDWDGRNRAGNRFAGYDDELEYAPENGDISRPAGGLDQRP